MLLFIASSSTPSSNGEKAIKNINILGLTDNDGKYCGKVFCCLPQLQTLSSVFQTPESDIASRFNSKTNIKSITFQPFGEKLYIQLMLGFRVSTK